MVDRFLFDVAGDGDDGSSTAALETGFQRRLAAEVGGGTAAGDDLTGTVAREAGGRASARGVGVAVERSGYSS